MPETNEIIRTWMREVLATTTRDGRPLTARKWALDAGVNAATVQRALRDDYNFTPSTKTLSALSQAVNVPLPPDMLTFSGAGRALAEARWAGRPKPFLDLPVRFKVAAGSWAEVLSDDQDEPRLKPAQPVPPYENEPQWLEEVVGDSYNRMIPEGSFVHVVDAIAIGYTPRTGDTVVVSRKRAQGALEERTLKQVEVTTEGVKLWPRSFNPRWWTPIDLIEGVQETEDVEVVIAGLVVRSYQFFG